MNRIQLRQFFIALIVLTSLWIDTPTRLYAADNSGIVTPAAHAVVNGVVQVQGTAQHPTFRKWQLDLLLHGEAQQAHFVAVAEKRQPTPGILTSLDTTRYPNGQHLLRLRVVYLGLNYDEYFVPIVIDNANAPPTDNPQSMPAAPLAPVSGPLGQGLPEGRRWIEIDISEQRLIARQGETVVLNTIVSTGKPGWRTLPGSFNVYVKYEQTRMTGPGYDTPDVPWTMYYDGGFAVHGAYWHNNFGTPVSHGCVNLRVEEAKRLFEWSSVGTEVVVRE